MLRVTPPWFENCSRFTRQTWAFVKGTPQLSRLARIQVSIFTWLISSFFKTQNNVLGSSAKIGDIKYPSSAKNRYNVTYVTIRKLSMFSPVDS